MIVVTSNGKLTGSASGNTTDCSARRVQHHGGCGSCKVEMATGAALDRCRLLGDHLGLRWC